MSVAQWEAALWFFYGCYLEGEIHLAYLQCLLKDEINRDLEMLRLYFHWMGWGVFQVVSSSFNQLFIFQDYEKVWENFYFYSTGQSNLSISMWTSRESQLYTERNIILSSLFDLQWPWVRLEGPTDLELWDWNLTRAKSLGIVCLAQEKKI